MKKVKLLIQNIFNYIKEIMKDSDGNPSSKRWIAVSVMIFLFLFINKISYFLLKPEVLENGIPEIGENLQIAIVWIVGILSLLLFSFGGFATIVEGMIKVLTAYFNSKNNKNEDSKQETF